MPIIAALPVFLAIAAITLVVNVVASLVVGAITNALTPKPGLKSTLQVSLAANDPRRAIKGRAATAGALVTFQTWGNNNEWIALLFRVADHKCKGFAPQIAITGNLSAGSRNITGVTTNYGLLTVGMPIGVTGAGSGIPTGAFITALPGGGVVQMSQQAQGTISARAMIANASVYWSGNPMQLGTGGAVPYFFQDGQDNCWVTFFAGDWNQVADSDMVARSGGRWTSASRGRGVAYVKVIAHANVKAFPSGLSQLFQFVYVIDGAFEYDRRLDSSVGGSGSQRFNDQSTWAWSNNSIVVAENLMRGLRVEDTMGVIGSRAMDQFFGLGFDDTDLPFSENVAEMNHCDDAISLNAGGTEPRYTCNGVITCDQTFDTVLGDVLATCAGQLLQSPGRFVLLTGVARTPVRNFVDSDFDITGPSRVTFDIPLDQIANAVTGQFADPASMYSAQPLPVRYSPTDAAADGGYKQATLDLSFVTSQTQGQRIQEIKRRQQRLTRSLQKALPPENLDLEPGLDWITWQSDHFGLTFTLAITQSDGHATSDDDGQMMIVIDAAEISSNVFAWNPATDELNRFFPAILPSAAPTPVAIGNLTVAAATITTGGQGHAALLVTRDALTDPTVTAVKYEYGPHPLGTQFVTVSLDVNPAAESGPQQAYLSTGVAGGVQYDLKATAVRQPAQDDNFSSVVTTSLATASATRNFPWDSSADPSLTNVVVDGDTWDPPGTGLSYRRLSGVWVLVNGLADGKIIAQLTGNVSLSGLSGQTPFNITVPANALGNVTVTIEGPKGGNGCSVAGASPTVTVGANGAQSVSKFAVKPGVTFITGNIGTHGANHGTVTTGSGAAGGESDVHCTTAGVAGTTTITTMVANTGNPGTSSANGTGGTASGGNISNTTGGSTHTDGVVTITTNV